MIFDELKQKFDTLELINNKIVVKSDLLEVLNCIKSLYDFDILTTIVAVDMIDYIELNYILYSTKSFEFLTISTQTIGVTPSVISLYKSAYFDECEIYDLFGVKFSENNKLKRLLMPENWEGHPLLKNYKQEDKRLVWNE